MSRNDSGRFFFGLFVIIIGVIFLLGSLDKLDVGDVFSNYWPMILIFFGLVHLLSHNFQHAGGGIIMILIGGFFQLDKLDLIGTSIWNLFWPVLIIGVGLWILVKPGFKFKKGDIPEIKDDDLGLSVILSGMKRRIESENFQGGKASVVLGSLELDFHPAQLAKEKAVVDLSVVLGEIKVFVPREWKVIVDTSSVLGEVNNMISPSSGGESSPTLFIKASAVLGEIKIRN